MTVTLTFAELIGVFMAGAVCAVLCLLGISLCQTASIADEQNARLQAAMWREDLDLANHE